MRIIESYCPLLRKYEAAEAITSQSMLKGKINQFEGNEYHLKCWIYAKIIGY
jgi:hypothetical protein